jgi:hypothetical protein
MLALEVAFEAADACTRLHLRLTCQGLRHLPQVGLGSYATIRRVRRAFARWKTGRPRRRRCSWSRRRVRTDDTPIL